MSAPWPIVSLGTVLRHRKEFVRIDDTASHKRCRVQLHAKGVVLRDVVDGVSLKTKEQQVCRTGEFLVAEIDAKMGGYGIVPAELDGAIVSSHYFLFEIDTSKLDRGFLGYFIRTPAFFEQVAAQGTTNYAAIRPAHVLAYRIPLPSLEQQRRIVAKIDELAKRVVEAQSARLLTERATHALWPAYLGRFFTQLGNVYPARPLAELASLITDGPHKTPQYVEEGVPFVTVRNMVTGKLDFSNLKYVSHNDHAEICRRCRPEQGDVLYSKDGATRGQPCFVDTEREFNIFVSVALIKPLRDRLDGRYLCHLLNSSCIKDRMLTMSRGDMIPHIVLREIRAFPVPAPTLAEQLRIVNKLDELHARIDRLVRLQELAAKEIDALIPTILNRAFIGELVAAPDLKTPVERKHSQGIYFKRAAIAAYIIDRLHARPTFGRVQLEKCLYLAEAYVGVDLEGEFKRAAAGPLDAEYLYKLESAAQKNGWFVKRTIAGDKTRHTYHPGAKSAQLLAAADKYLGAGKAKMDVLLGWMEKFDTERAEIVATLFAAWSDLLRAGHAVTDDAIITEVRENWHESKKRFEPTRLRIALGWMREHHLAPTQTDATIA